MKLAEWNMDPLFNPLPGDLLDTVRAGLNHEPDIPVDGGPPGVCGDPGQRGFHAPVASHVIIQSDKEAKLKYNSNQPTSLALQILGPS